jgi:hypothetical protein
LLTATRRISLLLLCLLSAAAARASRREYFVTLDGQRKAGSEVCFYAGVKDHTPFGLYFAGGAANCLSADAVLDVPSPGLFHAFARNREGYASGWRDYFVYDRAVPEKGYERYETPLIPGGWVDLSDVLPLKAGQTAGVWVSASSAAPTSFYLPLVAGETEILVPADAIYVPMIIADRRPILVGTPDQVSAKQTKVAKFARLKSVGDVVVWLRLDDPASEVQDDKNYVPPSVTIESAGRSYSSATSSLEPGDLTYSFLVFKDVATGPARIVVQGKHWINYDLPLDVTAETTVRTDALIVSPAGSLSVRWGAGVPAESEKKRCQSTADRSDEPSVKIALLRCEGPSATAHCTPVDRAEQPFSGNGDVTFPGVLAGDYKVRVAFPGAGPQSFPVKVGNRQDARVNVPVQTFHFFGRVMVNQTAPRARLLFETGEAESDEAGQYVADLAGNPLNNQVRVIVCDTGKQYRYVPPGRVQENSPLDITIDTASLSVVVVDADEHPVTGASVYYSPVKEKSPDGQSVVYYTSPEFASDSEGRTEIADAPRSQNLIVCARKGEYGPACVDVASDTHDENVKIKFAAGGIHGRVLGHDGHAVLTWVTSRGEISEQIQIAPGDGTFHARSGHDASEYLIYVSDRRPLTVVSLPPDFSPSRELDLPLPGGKVRSFAVKLSVPAPRKGYVGLFVGARYVPMQAFATHQEFRGHDVMIGGREALPVTDVLESAPIFVAFAPGPHAATGGFVDPFTLPEFSSVPKAAASGTVVFVRP